MPTLTVTSEGQVNLGQEALRHLGLQAGDQVEYELLAENQIKLHPVRLESAKRTVTVSDLYGILKRENQRDCHH